MDLAYGPMVRIDGWVGSWLNAQMADIQVDDSANNTNGLQTALQARPAKNPELLAKMVIREGKPFKSSAIACGYSPVTAGNGLARLVRDSSAVASAVNAETAAMMVGLDKLKPLAIQRLHAEITNPRSSMGMKAIELAGRFKETDWFVRNQDINIGVFGALGESGQVLDAQVLPDEEK